MMTWALSLVAIIAMSDRTLLTSHARCWIVGSLRYLLCHLTTCASASFSGNLEGWASPMQRQNVPWEESLALLIVFGAAWERRLPGTKGPVIRHLLAYRSFPPPYLTR